MQIDYNEIEMAAIEFSKQLREAIARGEDHCSCARPCRMHGNCVECVAAHRANRDHLPVCFRDMMNERLYGLSELTEQTIAEKIEAESQGV